jgi:glycosyltransferase involved in cell wall biosynthesis
MFRERPLPPSNKLVILCPSYFDRLGHPIFANKIKTELKNRFGDGVEIRGIATSSDNSAYANNPSVIPLSVVGGTRYTIDKRSDLSRRYGRISLLMIWIIRLVSVTHFYRQTFRSLDSGAKVIDLECEPIQAVVATFFASLHSDMSISFVIHSMPGEARSCLLSAYKRLSLTALRVLLRPSGRRAIFMNSAALESAVNKGIARERCVLGGWGYDMRHSNISLVNRPTGDRTVILAFGVMRKDKRISQLVELFLELDDPMLTLRIVGKSIDVDVIQLRQRIRASTSKSIIEILEGYVEEDKIAGLFADCHIVVLSHSAGFESMSGPMFLAIQYERPILCFSEHTVASLVQESGAGVVVRMEGDHEYLRSAIARLRDWSYDQATLQRFTWSAIADRMASSI